MKEINSIGRYGIVGKTGSGKSNTTFVLLADLRNRGQPLIVLDHKGEYKNLPNVQNIRAVDFAPGTLPMRLRNSNASIVIDLRGHRTIKKWMGTFLKSCMNVPRKYPILIAIEEAHVYCPQMGKANTCKTSIQLLASEGRSKGYGYLMISQNCSKLDKEPLKQADWLWIHRHTFKHDLNYLAEIVGDENKETIKRLDTGQVLLFNLKDDPDPPFQMPEAVIKKSGFTPEPQAVKENVKTFYDDQSLGAVGMGPSLPTGVGAMPDKHIIMILIVTMAIIAVIGLIVWKGITADEKGDEIVWEKSVSPDPY